MKHFLINWILSILQQNDISHSTQTFILLQLFICDKEQQIQANNKACAQKQSITWCCNSMNAF